MDVCVYYCRTYYKAVRGGGRRRVDSEDMCYVLDGVTVDFLDFWSVLSLVCVYYCRTYYKAVRGGARMRVEDMFRVYERRGVTVCVYYCRTYYKAVRGGGGVSLAFF